MPLTPEQIKATREQYGIKTDATALDISASGQAKNKPEIAGDALTSYLTDGKVKKTSSILNPDAGQDNIFSRGVKAVKEAASSVKDSFTKRGKDITDYTLKTAEEMNAAHAQVTPEDVKNFYSGTGDPKKINPVSQELLAPIKNALNTVGQVGGTVGDLLGIGLKAAYKTLTPEEQQAKLADGVHSLLQTPEGQAGLAKIKEGVDAYSAWAKENPDGAKAVENVVNVAGLFGGKAAEEVVTPVLKDAATIAKDKVTEGLTTMARNIDKNFDALDEVAREKVLTSLKQKAYDAVTPTPADLTPAEYDALVQKGKITPKSEATPAQYVLSDAEKAIIEKNASLLQSTDPVKNTLAITEEIANKDADVGAFLKKNNGVFNDGELRNFLTNKMKDITDITIDPERLDARKAQMVDNFISSLDKNNMENLWMNRKDFDSVIEKAFSGSPSLIKELKKGLRNGVQDFIADRTPDQVYKGYMKDMSQLFDLRDITATKATGEKGKNWLQVWIKQNPTKAKALGWTLASVPVIGGGYQLVK